MTGNILLDTQIAEPSMTADEAEMTIFAIDRSRAQFAWKCGGLAAAALRRAHPPSEMTLGGLIKHLALVEDSRTALFLTGQPIGPPWNGVGGDTEAMWSWGWSSAADDEPAELYRLWQAAVERTRAATARVLAAGGLDRPSTFTSRDGRNPNMRRALVDLHDEYARHVGHADLLREAIDGLVGEDPPRS